MPKGEFQRCRVCRKRKKAATATLCYRCYRQIARARVGGVRYRPWERDKLRRGYRGANFPFKETEKDDK